MNAAYVIHQLIEGWMDDQAAPSNVSRPSLWVVMQVPAGSTTIGLHLRVPPASGEKAGVDRLRDEVKKHPRG